MAFYTIRKIGRFIKRIVKWLPILWKQEDWDYEYLYDLMEVKMKELQECLRQDDIHLHSDKYVRQINICLAYLDRFRNWDNYIEYPTDDFKWDDCKNGCKRLEHTNKINEIKRKKAIPYEKFNYDMFWKRFLQWHQRWWC